MSFRRQELCQDLAQNRRLGPLRALGRNVEAQPGRAQFSRVLRISWATPPSQFPKVFLPGSPTHLEGARRPFPEGAADWSPESTTNYRPSSHSPGQSLQTLGQGGKDCAQPPPQGNLGAAELKGGGATARGGPGLRRRSSAGEVQAGAELIREESSRKGSGEQPANP
ncbi:unnamed protein product [Rangifer tarandus platyrhynchus]|uniref:Uncharacterized protein n=2 Tax=Rangifer tarandus platyrhynchus TaxID=3082113 RepID=A0ABN8ZL93_RANTA|nr:unnamed protein product [Rangifer tarandus platyrhynchus]CAI9706705.1 unnamed protein product [Rangifer tarandus platyrhynchus]